MYVLVLRCCCAHHEAGEIRLLYLQSGNPEVLHLEEMVLLRVIVALDGRRDNTLVQR